MESTAGIFISAHAGHETFVFLEVAGESSISILGDCSKIDWQFAGTNGLLNSNMHQKLRFRLTFLSSSEKPERRSSGILYFVY